MTVICPACKREFATAKSMGGHMQKCSVTPEQLFWSKVDKNAPNGCWHYMQARDKYGYGNIMFRRRHMNTHRLAWILLNGDPGALDVLHKCDNPPCCNPAHMFLGTQADNARDMWAKGRGPHGEKCSRRKLSEGQAREILSLKGKGPARMFNEKYGVGPGRN